MGKGEFILLEVLDLLKVKLEGLRHVSTCTACKMALYQEIVEFIEEKKEG